MEYSTSAPNERVRRITQLAKLSVNHPSVVLTAEVFQFSTKSSGGRVKINLKAPTLRTYQIHVVFQFNPTLPLQPQLALLLPGA